MIGNLRGNNQVLFGKRENTEIMAMLLQNYFDKILYVWKMTWHSWKKELQVLPVEVKPMTLRLVSQKLFF